jgi:hypothetical protein
MNRNAEPPRVATVRAPREVSMRQHHKQAGPPEQSAWDLLIRATLRTYHQAHGLDEGERRLRRCAWPR